VTKSRKHGRYRAFDLPMRSADDIKDDIDHVLQRARTGVKLPMGPKDLKRLRSRLCHAMCCDVAFSQLSCEIEFTVGETRKRTLDLTGVWKTAPSGAYYKAKRLCSLLTAPVSSRFNYLVSRDLTRLAINIWRLSKTNFDGLCRRIVSKLSRAEGPKLQSPEAPRSVATLRGNPGIKPRVQWPTRGHKGVQPPKEVFKKLLSTKKLIVLDAHKAVFHRKRSLATDG